MKIAITGSRGFIGAATVRAAEAAGHQVVHFDHADGVDVAEAEDVYEVLDGVEHVIHLAGVLGTAELFDDARYAVDVNVHGTLNVLQWCASSGAGYTGISMPPVFPSIYTATKICADRLATAYHHARGVSTSRVIAYNAYGPGQKHGPDHPQKIIPTFATEAWAGRPLPVWGDGEQTVDLIYVDDIAQMLVDATQFGDDDVFDAGTGRAFTVNEVAELVRWVTGTDSGIEYLPMRLGELPTKIVAEGRGWDKLSWRPEFSEGSLIDTVLSYKPVTR
jgi:UDP-glucose 4-epimerase